jgi:peptide deformylase
MIRKVIKVTDPKLRIKSKVVKKFDKKTLNIISDLRDTLSVQKDPEGVGLAAPQIGMNLNIFIMKHKGKSQVFINPNITILHSSTKVTTLESSGKKIQTKSTKIMEGCLSLPNYYGALTRPPKIKVEYQNENGEKITETRTGFEAQIIQHEVDHLNGVLFIDRLLEQKKPLFELVNGEWEEVEL